MSFTTVGHCPKCGAPVYAPAVWHSILPPPSTPSCFCNVPAQTRVVTTTETTYGNLSVDAQR